MPWNSSAVASGFTNGTPWLPVPPEHRAKAVESQLRDPDSVLQSYRRFVHWRRGQPALLFGDIHFLASPAKTLAFIRDYRDDRLLVVFNFKEAAAAVAFPPETPKRCPATASPLAS